MNDESPKGFLEKGKSVINRIRLLFTLRMQIAKMNIVLRRISTDKTLQRALYEMTVGIEVKMFNAFKFEWMKPLPMPGAGFKDNLETLKEQGPKVIDAKLLTNKPTEELWGRHYK